MKKRYLIFLLFMMCFVIVGCGNKNEKKEEKKKDSYVPGEPKDLKYFNDIDSDDSIAFILHPDYNGDSAYKNDLYFLVALNHENILSGEFKYDRNGWYSNDVFSFIEYAEDDDLVLDYENGSVGYQEFKVYNGTIEEKDGKKYYNIKLYDRDEGTEQIIYEDGRIFVTDRYGVYIYVGEYDGIVYTYEIKQSYSVPITDEAKKKEEYEYALKNINIMKNNFEMCFYKEADGIENCRDEKGNIVDYKKYVYVKDFLMKQLQKEKLYVESYEEIYGTSYGDIDVIKKSSLVRHPVEISVKLKKIKETPDDLTKEEELNGNKIYNADGVDEYFWYNNGVSNPYIYVYIVSSSESTRDNCFNILRETFVR